jgi:hypothetical protein
MAEEMLSINEVEEIAKAFFVAFHPGAMVSLSEVSLSAVGSMNVFSVKGEARTMAPGGAAYAPPILKKFELQVHPTQKRILGYKM